MRLKFRRGAKNAGALCDRELSEGGAMRPHLADNGKGTNYAT